MKNTWYFRKINHCVNNTVRISTEKNKGKERKESVFRSSDIISTYPLLNLEKRFNKSI